MKTKTRTRINAIATLNRDPIRNVLIVQRGGGCIGAIGAAFAFWGIVLGTMLIMGWRAGDFSMEVALGGGLFLSTLCLCGLGVATYRERITLDSGRRIVRQARKILLMPYWSRQWSFYDFEAVELYPYQRRGERPRWFDVIRLLPAKERGETAEPIELGAGDRKTMAKNTHDVAQEIADFCKLPLMQTSKRDELHAMNEAAEPGGEPERLHFRRLND